MKLFLSILICITFTLLSNFSFGQDFIYGKVIDKEGSPLFEVEVFWQVNNDIESDKQRTKTDGTFKIKSISDTQNTNIIIRKAGKKDISKLLEASDYNEFVTLQMEDKGVTSVTASRWEQDVNEIPASTIIITREEIAQNGFITFQEILENVPGLFTIDHRSESDVTIGIRGFWGPFNRSVMIQVNGVSMLSERQNDFPLNKINVAVESIDKIEIVRGPMSIIYGAGAFFGVINIITNDAKPGSSATLSTSFGLPWTQKNVLRYTVNENGLQLALNAMTYQQDGYKEKWNDMVSEDKYESDSTREIIYFVDGESEAITIKDYKDLDINKERYSKNHQAFNFSMSYKGFFTNINYALSNFGFSFLEPGPGKRNDYRSKTGNYQFGFRKTDLLNERFNFELKASYMNSKVDAFYKRYSDSVYTIGEDNVSSIRTELNTRSIILSIQKGNKIDFDVIGGIAVNRNFTNGSLYNSPETDKRNWYVGLHPDSKVDTYAGYIQAEIKKDGLQLVAGGRLEQQSEYRILSDENRDVFIDGIERRVKIDDVNDNSKLNFIPRLALIYNFQDKMGSSHYIKGMYGQSINQPAVVDNANDRAKNGLPYLAPETISTYELGYTYSNNESGLELNANLFRNELSSLITRTTITDDKTGKYIARSANDGQVDTNGLELIVNKNKKFKMKNSKTLTLDGTFSLSYQNTSYASENETNDKVSFSPPLLSTINLRGSYPINSGLLSFGVNANFVGEMLAYYSDETEEVLAGYISESTDGKTDSYWRWAANIRLSELKPFDDKKQTIYINFKVDNIFNKKYYYPTYTLNPWADKGVLGRGRKMVLSFGYDF
jgi:outer membrane receptor protein involved in Fe transport